MLGSSRGYADTIAHEFFDPIDWRDRRIHILGGSPPKQLEVVVQLTATDTPSASSGSTSSSSLSSRSASLTNVTSSADRQFGFLDALEGCGAV